MAIRFLPAVVLLLSLTLSSQEKSKDPKARTNADLAALVKELDTAEKDKVLEVVRAFAREHRPSKETVAVLTSSDKKFCIAIGANGSEKAPDGAGVEFTPAGLQYNIAVGGDGLDSTAGNGGNGGTVTLKAKGKGKVFLVGGNGGKGADGAPKEAGKKGGNGGNVWFGKNLSEPAGHAFGGNAGPGGKGGAEGGAGGTGGSAGSVGPEAPK